MLTVTLRISSSKAQYMTAMEDRNLASVEAERFHSTKTDDFEARSSVSQSLLTQEALALILPEPIANVAYHSVAQIVAVLAGVHVSKDARNDELE